jgi:hypothetical protein
MGRIYQSHNKHYYGVNASVKGVCMGASANWISNALDEKYTINPTDGTHMSRTKDLTKKFTLRMPQLFKKHGANNKVVNEENMINLLEDADVEGAIPKVASATKEPVIFVLKNPIKELRIKGVSQDFIKKTLKIGNGQLTNNQFKNQLNTLIKAECEKNKTLEEEGFQMELIKDTKWYTDYKKEGKSFVLKKWVMGNTKTKGVKGKKAHKIVYHITTNTGIYLFMAGSHVMAASNLDNARYFYDSEIGLFKCNNTVELYDTIKYCRISIEHEVDKVEKKCLFNEIIQDRWKIDNKEQVKDNLKCNDWENAEWACVKATGKIHKKNKCNIKE